MASRTTLSLRDLTAPVRAELELVAAELADDLRPENRELLEFVEHASSYRGKQLRAALVFLSARALGCEPGREHVEVAKIIELLHTATLVHDDVLDGASLRRNAATINRLHGPEIPVLLGDYIYARAFHMSVALDDPTCSRVLADVTRRICQGEITQIVHRFDFDWTVPLYEQVIRDKTASLYGAACRLGAHYAGAGEPECAALERFGLEVGTAFQIVDDCLDLDGEEGVVGKSLGTDLGKGKLTLPLLWLIREPERRAALWALMTQDADDAAKLAQLRAEFDVDAGIAHALGVARARVESATEVLLELPENPAREALVRIAEYVVARRR